MTRSVHEMNLGTSPEEFVGFSAVAHRIHDEAIHARPKGRRINVLRRHPEVFPAGSRKISERSWWTSFHGGKVEDGVRRLGDAVNCHVLIREVHGEWMGANPNVLLSVAPSVHAVAQEAFHPAWVGNARDSAAVGHLEVLPEAARASFVLSKALPLEGVIKVIRLTVTLHTASQVYVEHLTSTAKCIASDIDAFLLKVQLSFGAIPRYAFPFVAVLFLDKPFALQAQGLRQEPLTSTVINGGAVFGTAFHSVQHDLGRFVFGGGLDISTIVGSWVAARRRPPTCTGPDVEHQRDVSRHEDPRAEVVIQGYSTCCPQGTSSHYEYYDRMHGSDG